MSITIAQVQLSKSDAKAADALAPLMAIAPQLLFVFGAVDCLVDAGRLALPLAELFPDAVRIGCTTAGEITRDGVFDDTCILTALHFEHTEVREAVTTLGRMDDSRAAGERLAAQLLGPQLRAVMVFGQGVDINGSALLEGMTKVIGRAVPITGGLAGDGGAFKRTWTVSREGLSDRNIVAVGLYGERLEFGHGSFGGWAPFGPARKVTRCAGNVLYDLDGEPALDIYKRYLGEYAKDLPASGLLFPFSMLGRDQSEQGLIRTILGIDEAERSLILAGDIDPAGYLKLMHASTEGLVNGAQAAAEAAGNMMRQPGEGLAILVSCVGRKLAMGVRVDEEVAAIASVYGAGATLAGFYSYGEISPLLSGAECKLHNQTMTVTCLSES
ncbi:MAG: FIST N-terminal domain-containing protein [Massilia sp.]